MERLLTILSMPLFMFTGLTSKLKSSDELYERAWQDFREGRVERGTQTLRLACKVGHERACEEVSQYEDERTAKRE